MSVKQVASGDSHGCSTYFSTCPTLLISFSLLLSCQLKIYKNGVASKQYNYYIEL